MSGATSHVSYRHSRPEAFGGGEVEEDVREIEEDFRAWRDGPAMEAHSGECGRPVGSGSSVLEFVVVQSVGPSIG